MSQNLFSLCTLLIFSLPFHGICSAVNYQIINKAAKTPGGIKFMEKLGVPGAKEMMAQVNNFIWNKVLQQTSPAERKPIDTIELVILADIEGADGVANGNNINVSALFFDRVPDVKLGFRHLMSHEMTHVLQWYGGGRTPYMLIEGIADYTTLKVPTVDLKTYTKPGQGDRWDQGYAITARFLEYCDTITPSFVAKLNKKMRTTYDAGFFKNLTGKPVEQLWKDYKAKYGQNI